MSSSSPKNIYHDRRTQVLGLMKPASAMLVPGGEYSPMQLQLKDIDDAKPQASNFFYLSGYGGKQSLILLICGDSTRVDASQIIFSLMPTAFTDLWAGTLPSPKQLASDMKFDQGLPLDKVGEFLKEQLQGIKHIYYPIGESAELDSYICGLVNELSTNGSRIGAVTPTELIDSNEIFAAMRLVKSPDELAMIRQAASISVGGHKRLAEMLPNLEYEYQGEAELAYHYKLHNATAAFPSIVAGGINGCTLHYTKNDMPITPSDSLLVDSGASLHHYAADMTRCYPPREGDATAKEAYIEVYQEVLEVHKRLCATVKPGMTLTQLHAKAVEWLVESLVKLEILSGSSSNLISDLIDEGAYKKYYPHQTSHWIGLDVHDLGLYKEQQLGEGMVFSIEPGLYFAPDDDSVAPRWRGVCVRIEDTIAITDKGVENLTQDMSYWQNK